MKKLITLALVSVLAGCGGSDSSIEDVIAQKLNVEPSIVESMCSGRYVEMFTGDSSPEILVPTAKCYIDDGQPTFKFSTINSDIYIKPLLKDKEVEVVTRHAISKDLIRGFNGAMTINQWSVKTESVSNESNKEFFEIRTVLVDKKGLIEMFDGGNILQLFNTVYVKESSNNRHGIEMLYEAIDSFKVIMLSGEIE